jgi:hypothetical protein
MRNLAMDLQDADCRADTGIQVVLGSRRRADPASPRRSPFSVNRR